MSEYTYNEVYEHCVQRKIIKPNKAADKEKIQKLIDICKKSLVRLEEENFTYEEKTKNYYFLFRDYFDGIKRLAKTVVNLHGLQTISYPCACAFACEKHKEANINWDFLQEINELDEDTHKKKELDKQTFMTHKEDLKQNTAKLIQVVEGLV